ncbi:MAG TPA: DUF4397 domain-containing protein [Candidatus Didemnitutus sp.]|nr:DUF4397 domain-containing protein [Candidatus Didemnitutus sp.]
MRALSFLFFIVLFLAGCASEDPNIVDPPPGSRRIVVRLFNMIPDGASRKLLLEQNYQSAEVGQFRFSDSVRSPGDSSFVEIIKAGATEFRTSQRVRFIQNAIYDVFTLSKIGQPSVFDSVLIVNANNALTTLPVAQVRVVNLIADTTRFFDVRVGCPNGTPLTAVPVPFKIASLYSEVYPGLAVFSISEIKNGIVNVIGTYQCVLGERKAYSIIIYRDATSTDAYFLFVEENDLTSNAERAFIPVETRTADIRVLNLSSSSVDVSLSNTGQSLVKGLSKSTLSSITTAPTCEAERADVIEAAYSDGRTAIDSTSLTVRGKYTVITVDSGGSARLVITPTIQRPFGAVGKSVIRVVNASPKTPSVVVSLGARSDATAPNGIAAGSTIARNIVFDSTSAPIAVASGILPITVTTSSTPTTIIDVTRATVEPDKNYDLIIYDDGDQVFTALVEEEELMGPLQPLPDGVFYRLINGSNRQPTIPIQIGAVVPTGSVYYGNSLATTLPIGSVPYLINGVSGSFATSSGQRSLAVYAEGGGIPDVIEITTPPLTPLTGQTSRRVVNATEDVRLISVCIDSIPSVSGVGDHLALDVPYGTASAVSVSNLDRRGTYYIYDAETRTQLYTLPIQLAPLGNNYTFVVVGRMDGGYEVIVSQEF